MATRAVLDCLALNRPGDVRIDRLKPPDLLGFAVFELESDRILVEVSLSRADLVSEFENRTWPVHASSEPCARGERQ